MVDPSIKRSCAWPQHLGILDGAVNMNWKIQKKKPVTPFFRRKWMIPIYCLLGIMTAIMVVFLAATAPHFFIDHEFDSIIWRTQINKRRGMVNELLEGLKGQNYNRQQLIEMLGEPGISNDPEYRMTWSLADCDFSYRHC